MSALRRRARRVDLRLLDRIFAVALIVDLVLETLLSHAVPRSDRLATALFAVAFAAPIAVRRRWPAGAVIAVSLLALAQEPFHGRLFTLPSETACAAPILCVYGAAAWLPVRRAVTAVLVAAGLLAADMLIESYVTHVPGAGAWPNAFGIVFFFDVVPFTLGWLVSERSRRLQAFRALEDQTAAERAERERAAIAEERVAIGRELQDIIAHSVSVMVVQAGGARRLLYAQPDRARESMLTVEQTGRETLAEMRRLLGVLRHDADPRALAPQPGLDQLPELAEAIRARGLECSIEHHGRLIELTPGVDLVAYRVIEAALGDAAAHGCRQAGVNLSWSSGRLALSVGGGGEDAGIADRLRAISERVALYGGRLEVREPGDGAGATFAVQCRLPLDTALAA